MIYQRFREFLPSVKRTFNQAHAFFSLTAYGHIEKRKRGIRLSATNHLDSLGNLLDVLDRLEPQPNQLQVGHPSLLLTLRSPDTVSIAF
jgi:hypothetical protein